MTAQILRTIVPVVALSALVGAFAFDAAPQAQESDDEQVEVSPHELELYIDVYKAMQSDHGLTIDVALAQRQVSLEDFRDIERRVQREDRYVEQVREALLEYAKSQADVPRPGGGSVPPPER